MGSPNDPEKKPKAAYEVGYGKPPKGGQFKPGQSGNPTGGGKPAKSIDQLIDDELSSQALVKLGGEMVKMTKRRALAKRIVADALAGDRFAQQITLKLQAQASAGAGPGAEGPLTPEEIEQLLALTKLPKENDQ